MMHKTILITGATDGIGLATAKMLVSQGHRVLLHGRSPAKLEAVEKDLAQSPGGDSVETYVADLSLMSDVERLATAVIEKHQKLDVLTNNAGVFKTPDTVTRDELDIRFVVNTIAPYLLTQKLLPLFDKSSRVINVSSAAQSPVDLKAFAGEVNLTDSAAYAQSKLAITMWSHHMALARKDVGPTVIAVNPGSLLGSKMVQEAYGMPGGDIGIGAEILCRAAISDEFAAATGQYFDNDVGQFAAPHRDAMNLQKTQEIVDAIDTVLARIHS